MKQKRLIYGHVGLMGICVVTAVGLAIHPQTGQLWVTNNGRDLLGDDSPPETVYIVEEGEDYGWPSCHSGTVIDPGFGFAGACEAAGWQQPDRPS